MRPRQWRLRGGGGEEGGGDEAAPVAVQEDGEPVSEDSDHQEPGEGEMPAPPRRQAVTGGDSRPAGDGAAIDLAIGIGAIAEHTRCRDGDRADTQITRL